MKITEAIELNKSYGGFIPDSVLEEMGVIPEERWLFNNLSAMESIREGLEQSKSGAVKKLDLGSFARYADVDIDEEGEDE